jgi:uncharacterized protein
MKPNFLLDAMLGTLARWMRIGGYDTEYKKNQTDNELIEETLRSGRILLTRDKDLAKKAFKKGLKIIYLKSESDEANLAFLVSELKISFDLSNSRCPKCNGLLKGVSKEEVKEKVPQRSYNTVEVFWICESCRSIYWRGSHWSRITETLELASSGSPSLDRL